MTAKITPNIVVSGMRPTGKLHLGNYHGALKNWLDLQNKYHCYFFIADLHALTTNYANPLSITKDSKQMLIDWLAAGLDPNKATIFLQSMVPEHAELHLLLSMITPVSWLERVPTYKDQQQQLKDLDLANYGFLGYPLLQSADILIYQANFVPVGEDQLCHLELTREIVRRFNYLYKTAFPEPEALLTKITKFPGLDGRKMSKSYHNTIELTAPKATITTQIEKMPTDPARIRRADPGDPEKCPVWSLHKIYTPEEIKPELANGCKTAKIGCLDCKRELLTHLLKEQAPICDRAAEYNAKPELVQQILTQGAAVAATQARATLKEVRQVMGINA